MLSPCVMEFLRRRQVEHMKETSMSTFNRLGMTYCMYPTVKNGEYIYTLAAESGVCEKFTSQSCRELALRVTGESPDSS